MRSNFDDVGDFHEKFELDSVTHHGPGPRHVPPELLQFRLGFLKEELDEFERGVEQDDDCQMADALIDLVYVAMGTAQLMGYPWQDLWRDVQAANMGKVRVQVTTLSDSERGGRWDVVKPAGWQPPDTAGVLEAAGFELPDESALGACDNCSGWLDEGRYYEMSWQGRVHRFDSERCMRVWRLAHGAFEQAGHARA